MLLNHEIHELQENVSEANCRELNRVHKNFVSSFVFFVYFVVK